ncbi:shikimate dehydrogenase [Desulfohalotomaculum tongense]|nr:shikimate dehydrogenase [Desulforadius tongensis]MBM7854056.1 shikimate dehydrogenase [Desulforadius tongensis]
MQIDGRTTLCGLFGYPVEHSFSPAMHNAAFRALNLNWAYVPFRVEPGHLPRAVEAVRCLNLAGVNVTVPHKEAVLPYLDELTPAAKTIGAVNVILNNNGKLTGYNTDGRGFTRALREEAGFIPKAKKAVILGAGGAAKAVAVQLALEGAAEIVIINRTVNRGEGLAQTLAQMGAVSRVLTWEQRDQAADAAAAADLVVQATNVGMYPETNQCLPIPEEVFNSHQVVCDLIYNPVETKFLKLAGARGVTVVSGLGMLLYQGVLAFELWTKTAAPVEVMKRALNNQLGGRKG